VLHRPSLVRHPKRRFVHPLLREAFLPFSPPLIGEEEIAEVVNTLRSGWISTGPKARQFEIEFAQAFGAPAALALNSCTAGLHLALATLGVGPADQVITTPMTFCSSVAVIEHVGAKPVLVDVEPDTLNINPAAVADAVTPHTRAILPVHYAGHPVDMDPIRETASAHGLAIVEDAAHAVAGRYKGTPIGSGTNPAAFSFYATKNLTTGEGGMLTAEPEFIDRARVLSLHGMNRDAWKRYSAAGTWYYEVLAPGFKYNMMDIQAALGLWQLRKLPSMQKRRRQVAAAYSEAFEGHDALQIPACRANVDHAWHLYVLRLNLEALRIDRAQFIEEIRARNIGTSVHFIPVHLHPYYREKYGYRPEDYPIAYANYQRLLSLPLNPTLSGSDVDDVIGAVLEVAEQHRA